MFLNKCFSSWSISHWSSKNVFYLFPYQQLLGKQIPSSKSWSLLLQNIPEKMESNRWRVLKKNCHKVVSCAQLLRTKTLAAGSKWKCINFFFNFYCHLSYTCWVDVIYLTCLTFLKSLCPVWTFCAQTPLT